MDNINPATELAARLIEVSIKNTAQIIYNKIRAVKEKLNAGETINALEEVINDLIADKNELIQITACYEQEFVAQKISDSDIEYITVKLVPLIKGVLPDTQDQTIIKTIESLLSVETLKILQLLGFNYKEAIGIPLTNLVAKTIDSKTKKNGGTNSNSRKRQSRYTYK